VKSIPGMVMDKFHNVRGGELPHAFYSLSGRAGVGRYADAMVSGSADEHAALVALLQARPDGLSCPQITAELLEVGSAIEVWKRHVPATLMDLPGDVTPDSATRDVHGWTAQGYG
jgi:hypothetical protein